MNTSSNWSTTSTGAPSHEASAWVIAAAASCPGTNTATDWPARASAGTKPARAIEDLPQPDGPVTTSNGLARSRSTHSATSSARPKKASASSTSYGASPLYGQCSAIAGGSDVVASSSSWSRMARSRATISVPGSMPSSSTSVWRARRSERSASACRPQRYWAMANVAQRCSRSGSSATRTSAIATTSRCSPDASRASSRRSSVDRRSSSRRAASMRPGNQLSRTSNGGPRQRSRARLNTTAARSNSPVATNDTPRSTSSSKLRLSISSSARVSRYPAVVVSIADGPRARRMRNTQPCTTFDQDRGGSSPHNASANRSAPSTSPERSARAHRTTWSRRCSEGVNPPTLSAPITSMPTVRLSARTSRLSTGAIPARYLQDTSGVTGVRQDPDDGPRPARHSARRRR